MRVSEHYNLGLTQPYLDFVDVETNADLQLYIDPRALRLFTTEWGTECVSLVQHFFDAVLEAVRAGDRRTGLQLLSRLTEPNETRLGMSRGLPRGRALGPDSAAMVWAAFASSEAARTGLLDDLSDALLMVEGIGPDIVSDITTNVIREPLIRYTQHVADLYGIPLLPGVDSGALWDPTRSRWKSEFVALPAVEGRKLLLMPKAVVRLRMDYDVQEYYRGFVLTHLQQEELNARSSLVHLLSNGTPGCTRRNSLKDTAKGSMPQYKSLSVDRRFSMGTTAISASILPHLSTISRWLSLKGLNRQIGMRYFKLL